MKRIELKILKDKDGTDFNYKVLLFLMTEVPMDRQGSKLSEQRKAVRLQEKIEEADDVLLLEDADHTLLCQMVNNFTWNKNSKLVVQLSDDVLNAPIVEKEKDGEKKELPSS